MYRTDNFSIDIKEYEVTKSTARQIYFRLPSCAGHYYDICELKNGTYHEWHESKAAAIEYLVVRELTKIKHLNEEKEACQNNIDKLYLMEREFNDSKTSL